MKKILALLIYLNAVILPGNANIKDVKIIDPGHDFCMTGEEIVNIANVITAATDLPINLIVVPHQLPFGLSESNQQRAQRFNQILAKSFAGGRIPIMLYCNGNDNWTMDGPVRNIDGEISYNYIRWENFPISGSEGRILIPALEFNLQIPF